jgi:hypothetical protein
MNSQLPTMGLVPKYSPYLRLKFICSRLSPVPEHRQRALFTIFPAAPGEVVLSTRMDGVRTGVHFARRHKSGRGRDPAEPSPGKVSLLRLIASQCLPSPEALTITRGLKAILKARRGRRIAPAAFLVPSGRATHPIGGASGSTGNWNLYWTD